MFECYNDFNSELKAVLIVCGKTLLKNPLQAAHADAVLIYFSVPLINQQVPKASSATTSNAKTSLFTDRKCL